MIRDISVERLTHKTSKREAVGVSIASKRLLHPQAHVTTKAYWALTERRREQLQHGCSRCVTQFSSGSFKVTIDNLFGSSVCQTFPSLRPMIFRQLIKLSAVVC